MIYTGTTAPTESTKVVMTGTGTQINATTYKFYNGDNNPSYVGYMFTKGQQHGNGTPSTIKTAIDNWYKTTTLETDATTKSLVADQIFCNDRSATTSSSGTPGEISGSMSASTTYYYGAYVRLVTNKSPKLTCQTASDKFTVNTSSIGNKVLEYPVGLITADEVAMAGGVYGSSNRNSSYYLYTNQSYWLGSPISFYSSSFANGFDVYSTGALNDDFVTNTSGARPVVSLSSKSKLSGNGTYSNPYTVS
ncbi:unknown [Mycoplasma sp. CAG:472]|nr:unknown [Mycoplasma sp. CAG:472]